MPVGWDGKTEMKGGLHKQKDRTQTPKRGIPTLPPVRMIKTAWQHLPVLHSLYSAVMLTLHFSPCNPTGTSWRARVAASAAQARHWRHSMYVCAEN